MEPLIVENARNRAVLYEFNTADVFGQTDFVITDDDRQRQVSKDRLKSPIFFESERVAVLANRLECIFYRVVRLVDSFIVMFI